MHAESGKETQFLEQVNRLGVGFNEALNAKSLAFLQALWHKAVFPFDQWLTKFERSGLQLHAHQLDTVIAILHTEMTLSDDIMDGLHDYLLASPHAESMINALLPLHASELNELAFAHHLMHHALPHGLEVAHRVNQVMDHFSLLTVDDATCRFLRAVVTLMVQFHDHDCKNKEGYHSVEEATAARVSGWITHALAISEHANLKQIIDFIAARIIVLGTTMISSATRTMDLSELYFDIRDLATLAKYPIVQALPLDRSSVAIESKADLVYCMDAILLLVGVCDKNPASIYDVVVKQAGDETQSTLTIMHHYFQRPLLFDQFFKSNAFFSSFDSGVLPAVCQQAFLIALITHVSMQAEVSGPCSHAFMDLIAFCRQERLRQACHADFMAVFHAQCIALDMNRTVAWFFFETMGSAINSCVSQERGLVFVVTKLMSMGFSPKSMTGIASGHFQPMITPRAPVRDANNLKALKLFYEQLDDVSQTMLISEILLAIVVQVGELQVVQLGLDLERHAAPLPKRGSEQSNFFVTAAINRTAYLHPSVSIDACVHLAPSSIIG